MLKCLTEYYRCPDEYLSFAQTGVLCKDAAYFQFGRETTCYGSYAGRELAAKAPAEEWNALDDIKLKDGTVYLPFDPCEVINNLRYDVRRRLARTISHLGFGGHVLFRAPPLATSGTEAPPEISLQELEEA